MLAAKSVSPPASFLSGAPGWTLGAGAFDTLRYAVTLTGVDTGLARVEANVRMRHR